MSLEDYLRRYAEGWTHGDAETILSATADSFVFDDPNDGQIPKGDFAAYLAWMRKTVDALRGADYDGVFMELSEILVQEEGGALTASCWWAVPGTEIQGSGLIKVGADGVISERIAYYTKLPA